MATLMIAQTELQLQTAAGSWPPAQPGHAFWVIDAEVADLVATGQAIIAPAGTQPPEPPPYTVRGVPGLARATANSSH